MPPRWPSFNQPCDLVLWCDQEASLHRGENERFNRDPRHSVVIRNGEPFPTASRPCPVADCEGEIRPRPDGPPAAPPRLVLPPPPPLRAEAPANKPRTRKRKTGIDERH